MGDFFSTLDRGDSYGHFRLYAFHHRKPGLYDDSCGIPAKIFANVFRRRSEMA